MNLKQITILIYRYAIFVFLFGYSSVTLSNPYIIYVPIGVDGICVILESTDVLTAANGDTVNLSITATQCFSDEEGNSVPPGNWCQTGGERGIF